MTLTTTTDVMPANDAPRSSGVLDNTRGHLVTTTESAMEFLRWLGERRPDPWIGIDIEGTGLDIATDRVRLVQFGDTRDGWVIPFERAAMVVDDAISRYQGLYVGHNLIKYDLPMLRKEGIDIPPHRVHDTLFMSHVLSSTEPLALKFQAQKYVDPRAKAGQDALDAALGGKGGWTWATIPWDYLEYWVYAALDPILTVHVANHHWPLVQAEAPRSYDLEMAVAWVCEKMERKGAPVNRARTQEMRDQLATYVSDVTQWVHTTYGVSPGSNEKIAQILINEGVTLEKKTEAGRWCLDKDVLSEIDHPLAQAVLKRRKADKLVGTYLESYLRFSERDGRIHPSINTVGGKDKNPFESGGKGQGVRTGRMSMSDPNLQFVPIRTDMGKAIRRLFEVQTGMDTVWIKADFDQIEMRILAHLAEDPGMINAFVTAEATGGDFFVEMARQIFNDPTIQKNDPRRQPVKNSGYAVIYGAGLEQFAKTANMRLETGELDLEGARSFLDRFHQLYPGGRQFSRSVENQASQRRKAEGVAYVRSPLTGRKHTADRWREYVLVNYTIQGMAGEVMKMKIVEADAAGLGDYMMFPVHDEIDLEAPMSRLPEVIGALQGVMNDAALLRVPVSASIGVGPNWGDVRDL